LQAVRNVSTRWGWTLTGNDPERQRETGRTSDQAFAKFEAGTSETSGQNR
jgi:hypothetical protein